MAGKNANNTKSYKVEEDMESPERPHHAGTQRIQEECNVFICVLISETLGKISSEYRLLLILI